MRLIVAIAAMFGLSSVFLFPSTQVEADSMNKASQCTEINERFPHGLAKDRSSRRAAVAIGFQAPDIKPAVYKRFQKRVKPSMPGVLCPVIQSSGIPSDIINEPDPQLEALAARVESAGANCLVIRRDGRIAREWYWRGTRENTQSIGYSTMKSVAATLVGIAENQGLLDIDQPASDFITEWRDTASNNVTIRQLLSMTSGREIGNQRTLALDPDFTSYAVGLGQRFPAGTQFFYGDAPVQALARVLTRASGEPLQAFANRELLQPLGLKETQFLPDASNGIHLAFLYTTTCRDLSALVQLYMDGGVWNGQRLLSQSFINQALNSSSALGTGYGFLIWLNTPGTSWFNTALPPDAFDFRGLCGQIGRGIPSQRLVLAAMTSTPLDQTRNCESSDRGIGLLRKILTYP
jgi:CubicO group peptidase (beta-lactamase class C family)